MKPTTHAPEQPGFPGLTSPLPQPPVVRPDPAWSVPSDEQCRRWWTEFDMLPHIQAHSLLVAQVATFMAKRAVQVGLAVDVQTVRASALLHDLAKTYTIRHSGNHSQLGAAWTMELTGNPQLSQGVMHHVSWPFEMDVLKYFLPMAVLYADKRISHDRLVTMGERFLDLMERYGKTIEIGAKIRLTQAQALAIEASFSRILGVDLNACTFDCGRLVERA